MCGIGYMKAKEAPILINGLKPLEYRGGPAGNCFIIKTKN